MLPRVFSTTILLVWVDAGKLSIQRHNRVLHEKTNEILLHPEQQRVYTGILWFIAIASHWLCQMQRALCPVKSYAATQCHLTTSQSDIIREYPNPLLPVNIRLLRTLGVDVRRSLISLICSRFTLRVAAIKRQKKRKPVKLGNVLSLRDEAFAAMLRGVAIADIYNFN